MKRFLSLTLAILLLVALIPTGVSAAAVQPMPHGEEVAPMESKGSMIYESVMAGLDAQPEQTGEIALAGSYIPMTSSQKLIEVIKDFEGFRAYKYWDYTQYTIGYGTRCSGGDYPNGISRSEAERQLKIYLTTFENEVNAFFKRIGRQPTQQQFDAMMDFTYNLGGGWTYRDDYLICKVLKSGASDMEVVRALGSWCHAGSSINTTLAVRRIIDAIIFTKGEYFAPYGVESNGLRVISFENTPYYAYCIFNGNGVSMSSKYSEDINFYPVGYAYGSVPAPTRSGYKFGWWQRSDGTMLSAASTVKRNCRVYARWFSGSVGTQPSDPDNEGRPTIDGTYPGKPTTVTKPQGNGVFWDVSPNSWYNDAVMYVYEKGYMTGTEKDAFKPDGTMTRGMLVTVLYRMAGKPSYSGSMPFKDVKSSQYYYTPVMWANAMGIVTGTSSTTFEPESLVSREQIAAILYRYYTRYLGRKASNTSIPSSFTDRNKVSDYAKDAMGWAINSGIINGTSATLLEPAGDATRCQAAAMIQRFAKLVL